MSFKFGLSVKSKTVNGSSQLAKSASAKKKALFGDDEEDNKEKAKVANGPEEIGEFNFDDTVPNTPKTEKPAPRSKGKPPGPPTRKPLAKEDDPTTLANTASTAEAERRAAEAVKVDATIYDYDAAYDALHARTVARKAAEKEEALQRRPKYMDNLFESAEQRKKDQLRARDKVIQRERDAEGDEFADKDKFVTGAYKAQQEEARKAEEEERKKQEVEDEKRRKFGMQSFHKQRLLEEEKRHQDAMEAAAQMLKEGVEASIDEPDEKTDADIAKELQAQGKNIDLNEEGQVADKRQLLSAGLNIVAKPQKAVSTSADTARPSGPTTGTQSRNATQRDIRARHTQMIADQIEQATKRKAEDDAEEQRKLERASKSQKTEGEISSAKERYLQRKKEAAAAKAAATGK